MQIQWFGQACFKITVKHVNEEVTIITDPYNPSYVGLPMSKQNADIVTISHEHEDHNCIEQIKSESYLLVNTPGEYERKTVMIYGVPSWHDATSGSERGSNTIFRFEAEDITFAHLGDLGHPLSAEQLEVLQGVDILMIPVGGVYTINAELAAKVCNAIEPRIVIPMHYNVAGLKFKLDPVELFIKEMGISPEKMDKFKILKKDLPQDSTRLVILSTE